MADTRTPYEVLKDAKLSGTTKHGDTVFTYSFRTNEQAAEVAIRALGEAGYKVIRKSKREAK